jgi:peptidoglycan DL-endopeptidase CwlO
MTPISAVADVQARIADIESRFGRAGGTNAASFQNALNSAIGVGASAASGSGVSGQQVVDSAKKYIGVPYKWGGTDPATGLDCSGFVQKAFADVGISLPRVAADQAKQGTAVSSMAQAKPGDLLAFGSPVDHIGIYIGNNKMIAASSGGGQVKIQDVYETPTAIRRVVPEAGSFGAAGGVGGVAAGLSSQFDSLFVEAGKKYGISPNLLAAVAKQESGFNPRAGSHAGAQGLMQFMPATAKGMGVNPWDPASAVDGAARMLTDLNKKFGSMELALAGYNAGPGAVQKYNGVPPYKETQHYVKNVMALANSGGGI